MMNKIRNARVQTADLEVKEPAKRQKLMGAEVPDSRVRIRPAFDVVSIANAQCKMISRPISPPTHKHTPLLVTSLPDLVEYRIFCSLYPGSIPST
jgi:hypothetical protein